MCGAFADQAHHSSSDIVTEVRWFDNSSFGLCFLLYPWYAILTLGPTVVVSVSEFLTFFLERFYGYEVAAEMVQKLQPHEASTMFIEDRAAHHHRTMATPPGSPPPPPPPSPPPPPPPPPANPSTSSSTMKRTRKATRLRSLATRPPGAERPVVHVNPTTGKADGPQKKKLRTYLGIVAHDRVDVTYETWKEVLAAQKDLIWEDIQAEFEIPEAFDNRTKKKVLQMVGEQWRQFKSNLTRKWALVADKDGVDDTVCEKYGISKEKWAQFCQTHRDPSWDDVRKKAQAIQKQNTAPPRVISWGL
ncbi:hypothetical protein HKD37_11G032352 [Glycine soja]